jgi:hypothetical protein
MAKINYLAVGVAGVLYWILGAVWYGLFSQRFVALMRWTPEDLARIQAQGSARELALAFATSMLTAYALAHFLRSTGARSAAGGALTGLLLFVGFVLTTNLATVIFEGRPAGLYLINMGYNLVALLLMGALLAVWRRHEARVPAYQT